MPGSSHPQSRQWVFSCRHPLGRSLRVPVLPAYTLPQARLPRGVHRDSELADLGPRKETGPCLHRVWHPQLAQSLGLRSSANSGRLAPETTLYLEVPLVRSLRTSFPVPQFSKTDRFDLLRSIESRDTLPVEINLFTAMDRRQSGLHKSANGSSDLWHVVHYELVGHSHPDALFTAVDRPDESTVGRIKFLDSRLLLNHLGAIQPQPCFLGQDDVARKAGRQ